MGESAGGQDELYEQARAQFGGALERLAYGYEADPDLRRDLLQDIHVAVWQSLKTFGGRCSLRTWVYRVAHNTAVSRIVRRRGRAPTFLNLDDYANHPALADTAHPVDTELTHAGLVALIQKLPPLDRQIIILYLEDVDAASIAEIVGTSPGNVATRVHRIKKALSQRFQHEGQP